METVTDGITCGHCKRIYEINEAKELAIWKEAMDLLDTIKVERRAANAITLTLSTENTRIFTTVPAASSLWSGSKHNEATTHVTTTGHTVEEWEMQPARKFSRKKGGIEIRRYS